MVTSGISNHNRQLAMHNGFFIILVGAAVVFSFKVSKNFDGACLKLSFLLPAIAAIADLLNHDRVDWGLYFVIFASLAIVPQVWKLFKQYIIRSYRRRG